MLDKEVAWNIFQLTMSDDEAFDKILDIQRYCKQVFSPPEIPTEPIEDDNDST